jgi:hypothetical protein
MELDEEASQKRTGEGENQAPVPFVAKRHLLQQLSGFKKVITYARKSGFCMKA